MRIFDHHHAIHSCLLEVAGRAAHAADDTPCELLSSTYTMSAVSERASHRQNKEGRERREETRGVEEGALRGQDGHAPSAPCLPSCSGGGKQCLRAQRSATATHPNATTAMEPTPASGTQEEHKGTGTGTRTRTCSVSGLRHSYRTARRQLRTEEGRTLTE